MKKIGIATCYCNKNYGSMLQSFATLIVLKDMGCEGEFINYQKKYTPATVIKSLPRVFNSTLMREKMRTLHKQLMLRTRPDIKMKSDIRNKAFERFPEKYYGKNISTPRVGYKELKACAQEYDAVLVGSDQLWLPAGLPTKFYTLSFVPDSKVKISYSTSFGVSKIPFYQIRRTKQYLNRIDYIGVREKTGQQIIKKLTGRSVEVVLDPTLLLYPIDWEKYIPNRKIIDGKYIFCYFLGGNQEYREQVTRFGIKMGLKVYTMPYIDEFVKGDCDFGDMQLFDVDPANFVNLIRNAEYILTDSFHASIFSILYHKQFIVFDRYTDPLMKTRNSRIENLCEITGLQSRRFKTDAFLEMLKEINYKDVDNKIETLRIKSKDYLKKALDEV